MKRLFLHILGAIGLCAAAIGCNVGPASTPLPSPRSTLAAFPAPCRTDQTRPAEDSDVQIPTTGGQVATPCGKIFLPAVHQGVPASGYCAAIKNGLAFLTSLFNPDLGLLNEAPKVAPHTYWLTNDNALAAFTFAQLGQAEMSAAVEEGIQRFGSAANGLIEVMWGVPVVFPPYDAIHEMIVKVGEDEIWQEYHDRGPILDDWKDYANLGFLGALNAYHRGEAADALSIFASTLDHFDGTGFHDKAFSDRYETYKLALALYVGAVIQAPNAYRDQMLSTMLSMQGLNGGFYTHYRDPLSPEGDTNTETSALALLALEAYGCGLP